MLRDFMKPKEEIYRLLTLLFSKGKCKLNVKNFFEQINFFLEFLQKELQGDVLKFEEEK